MGIPGNSQFFNPPEIEGARPSVGTKNIVPFFKKQFGKVGTILPGNTGNQRCFHRMFPMRLLCGMLSDHFFQCCFHAFKTCGPAMLTAGQIDLGGVTFAAL